MSTYYGLGDFDEGSAIPPLVADFADHDEPPVRAPWREAYLILEGSAAPLPHLLIEFLRNPANDAEMMLT